MTEIDDKMMSSMNQSISTSLGQYNIHCPLSRGSDGFVIKIQQRLDKKYFALKVVAKNSNKKRLEQRIQDEITIHKMLRHPNIVRLLTTFQDFDNHYMVLEYCEQGDLQRYAHKNAELILTQMNSNEAGPRNQAKELAYRIGEAVQYLHEKKIVHRDIKPNNILVTQQGVPKLCDFGYSALIKPQNKGKFKDFVGTLNYVAPEIVHKKEYDHKVDIWAYGCVLYFLSVGRTPFSHESLKQTFEKLKIQDILYPSSMHPALKELLMKIFCMDPVRRPEMTQVLTHPYFSEKVITISALAFTESSKSTGGLKRSDSFQKMATIKQQQENSELEDKTHTKTKRNSPKANTGTAADLRLRFQKEDAEAGPDGQYQKDEESNWNNVQPTSRRQSPRMLHKREHHYAQRTAQRRALANESLDKLNKAEQEHPELVLQKQTSSESNNASSILTRFSTQGITEQNMQTVHGNIRIDGNGFTKDKDAKGLEWNVSQDGRKITIRRGKKERIYGLEELPSKYHSLYKYCAEVVRIIRENMSLAKVEDKNGAFWVMGSGKLVVELTGREREEYSSLEEGQTLCRNPIVQKRIQVLRMLLEE